MPDLDAVVLAHGDELSQHLVVGQIDDVVHVGPQDHVVAGVLEVENGDGPLIRRKDADLVRVIVHVAVGNWASRVDLRLQILEIR